MAHPDNKQTNSSDTVYTFAVNQEYNPENFQYDDSTGIYLAECKVSGYYIMGQMNAVADNKSKSGLKYMPENSFKIKMYEDKKVAQLNYDRLLRRIHTYKVDI